MALLAIDRQLQAKGNDYQAGKRIKQKVNHIDMLKGIGRQLSLSQFNQCIAILSRFCLPI